MSSSSGPLPSALTTLAIAFAVAGPKTRPAAFIWVVTSIVEPSAGTTESSTSALTRFG